MIGAVSFYSAQLTTFQDEHIRLLETIAHIAADAINAARITLKPRARRARRVLIEAADKAMYLAKQSQPTN